MTFAKPEDGVPSNMIVPTNRSATDVPEGWLLCDGNNGTPDLRNKFVKGVPDTTTVAGTTGGTNTQSLTESQLPSHTHGGSTGSTNSHTHEANEESPNNDVGQDHEGHGPDGPNNQTSANGAHSHQDISSGETGGNGSYDNQPNYTEQLFIQRA